MVIADEPTAKKGEPDRAELARYIEQLGAGDFHLREQAQEKLLEFGLDFLEEIREAGNHDDPEISDRARQISSELEQGWILAEKNPEIRELIADYLSLNNAGKLELIQNLTEDFPGGEGIETLCRFVRFESSDPVRFAAVKEIIGVAPASYPDRQKWYDAAAKHLSKVRRKNETSQFLDDFLILRSEIGKFGAEKEKSPGIPAPDELKGKLEEWTKQFERFHDDEKYSGGHLESDSDVLYHYALADLQDALGLEKELEKTLKETKKVSMWGAGEIPLQPGKQRLIVWDNPYLHEGRAYGIMAHFEAATHLFAQYRLKWAEREYSLIAGIDDHMKTEGQLKWFSRYSIALILDLKADNQKSVELLGEILEAGDKAKDDLAIMSFVSLEHVKIKKLYYQAVVAAKDEKWDAAAALLDEAVKLGPDTDYLTEIAILRFSLKDRDEAYEKETENLIDETLEQLEEKLTGEEYRHEQNLNTIAWLMAHTGRDPEKAIEYSKRSLESNPDDPAALDTLAHAYFAAGRYDDAVETQEKVCLYAPEATLFRKALEKFRKGADDK